MYQSFPHDPYNTYFYSTMNKSTDDNHSLEFRARSQTWGGNESGYRARLQELSPSQQYTCCFDSLNSNEESVNSLQDHGLTDKSDIKSNSISKGAAVKKTSRKNPWGQETYADLIESAINSYPNKMATLQQIYDYISKNYKYFMERSDATSSAGWKNSIRHNLSLHDKFLKCPKKNENMKSSLWSINQNCMKRSRSNSLDCKNNTLDLIVKRRLVKEQRRSSATNSNALNEPKRSLFHLEKPLKSEFNVPKKEPMTDICSDFADMDTDLKYMPPDITTNTTTENNLYEDLEKLGMCSMEPIYNYDDDNINCGRSEIPNFHVAAMEYSKFVADLFIEELE